MSSVADAFTELFYGTGSWLGLLLFLVIIMVVSLKNRLIGVLMIPVTIFLAINYLNYPTLMWNALIMFFCTFVLLFNIMHNND